MSEQQPIMVNATPTAEQVMTGVRQFILVAAAIASALGYAHAAGQISGLLSVAGPIAGLIIIVLGQLKTRQSSQTAATLARALPDSVAQTK